MKTISYVYTDKNEAVGIKIGNDEPITFREFSEIKKGVYYINESVQYLSIALDNMGVEHSVISGRNAIRIKGGVKVINIEKWRLPNFQEDIKLMEEFVSKGELPPVGIAVSRRLSRLNLMTMQMNIRETILSSSLYEDNYKPAYNAGIIESYVDKGKHIKNVLSYDISSAYPAAIIHGLYPIEDSKEVLNVEDRELLQSGMISGLEGYIGRFILDLKRKDGVKITPISYEDIENNGFDHKWDEADKYGLISGTIEVAASLPEMIAIAETYDIVDYEIIELYSHKLGKSQSMLIEYIENLYERKKRDLSAKIILNTISGISARNPIKDIKGDITIEKIASVLDKYNGLSTPFPMSMGVIRSLDHRHAMYMNAWVRLKVIRAAKMLTDRGIDIIYIDTDSIKVSSKDRKTVSEVFKKLNDSIDSQSGIGLWTDESDEYSKGIIVYGKRFYVKQGKQIESVMAGCDKEVTNKFLRKMKSLRKIEKVGAVAAYRELALSKEGIPMKIYRVFKV